VELEQRDAEGHAPGRQTLPGLIIQINTAVLPPVQPSAVIEHDVSVPRPLDRAAFGARSAPSDNVTTTCRGS
jgi:hypothetical protein